MTTAYVPVSGSENYTPLATNTQETLTFETGVELISDLSEHLETSYALLERDDI